MYPGLNQDPIVYTTELLRLYILVDDTTNIGHKLYHCAIVFTPEEYDSIIINSGINEYFGYDLTTATERALT